jgi:hypothetical protein
VPFDEVIFEEGKGLFTLALRLRPPRRAGSRLQAIIAAELQERGVPRKAIGVRIQHEGLGIVAEDHFGHAAEMPERFFQRFVDRTGTLTTANAPPGRKKSAFLIAISERGLPEGV